VNAPPNSSSIATIVLAIIVAACATNAVLAVVAFPAGILGYVINGLLDAGYTGNAFIFSAAITNRVYSTKSLPLVPSVEVAGLVLI